MINGRSNRTRTSSYVRALFSYGAPSSVFGALAEPSRAPGRLRVSGFVPRTGASAPMTRPRSFGSSASLGRRSQRRSTPTKELVRSRGLSALGRHRRHVRWSARNPACRGLGRPARATPRASSAGRPGGQLGRRARPVPSRSRPGILRRVWLPPRIGGGREAQRLLGRQSSEPRVSVRRPWAASRQRTMGGAALEPGSTSEAGSGESAGRSAQSKARVAGSGKARSSAKPCWAVRGDRRQFGTDEADAVVAAGGEVERGAGPEALAGVLERVEVDLEACAGLVRAGEVDGNKREEGPSGRSRSRDRG